MKINIVKQVTTDLPSHYLAIKYKRYNNINLNFVLTLLLIGEGGGINLFTFLTIKLTKKKKPIETPINY